MVRLVPSASGLPGQSAAWAAVWTAVVLEGLERALASAEALTELDNLLTQAAVVLHSAAHRTESRGAHAREDFPQRDDVYWLKHTLAWRDGDGRIAMGDRPVTLNPLSNEVASFPPKERVY